jgi:tRNA isopentenyl-2-thiomethyl-A-37 hydroxylase MiaE
MNTTIDVSLVKNFLETFVNDNSSQEEIIELGCTLWDLSGVKEFSKYFVQQDLVRHLTKLIKNENNSERLKEICFGILTNIILNENSEYTEVNVFFKNLQFENVQLLSEMIKFLYTCIMTQLKKEIWIPETRVHLAMFVMILNNTLVDELKLNVLTLLHTVAYYDSLSSKLLSTQYLDEILTSFEESTQKFFQFNSILEIFNSFENILNFSNY